jgi:hypothetical protein
MVLVQIYVPYTANNTYFDVPLYGVYDIMVVSVQFHDSGANTQMRVVQIQSDVLRFQHSNQPYLTFINNAQTYLNLNQASEMMPSLKNIDVNGRILINANVIAGTAFNNWYMVITLEATCSSKAK